MDKHTIRILEYKDVIEIIAGNSTNVYGREYIEARKPMDNPYEIAKIQAETSEAMRILDSTESFIVGQMEDIRPLLSMAFKGIALQTREILKVLDGAARSRLLKKYLSTREFMAPKLSEKSEVLESFPRFEKEVKNAIDPDGKILDRATSRLAGIRKELRVLNGRVHRNLEQFLKQPQYRTMLQEALITQREHRYVVPVKQEYRGQFPGLVLDTSASGATLFMEPLVVLKMTNEIKFQQSEEKHEEEQIRLKLSGKIADIGEALLGNLEFLGYYDSLQAAARFYYELNCILPRISEKPIIDLKDARHPLLGEKAVPIDMRVGEDFLGLIITGPNTGGKTVTLKTTGLITLLALSGFPIPAGEGSIVGIFTGIFADIGDEQSISQNLSTFSSHMTNIIKMITEVDGQSLVLLDEIGAGTDPSEGVALGASLINYFINKSSRVIATTHYNELKHFASHNDNLRNAAVEFDEETLQPTYKLSIGLPGRSCALKIAGRLGLKEEILADAREALGSNYFEIEALLLEIDQEKALTRKESEEAETHKEEMKRLKDEYDEKLNNIEQERQQILEEAMNEGIEFTDVVFREVREARKEWRKSLKDYKKGKLEREEARKNEEKVKSSLNRAIKRLKKMQKKEEKKTTEELPTFSEDDPVSIPKLGKRGRVVQILSSETALIQVGNIKMEIPLANLEPMSVEYPGQSEEVTQIRFQKAMSISDRLDIRGHRVDEALSVLSKYLDDASLANLSSFQILHGKGTGALRKAVQEYLSSHKCISSFRDGELYEGGWGVTMVKL